MTRSSALGVWALIVWGLVMSCSSAEKQYFPVSEMNVSWADAHKHCQLCFSELVTLTPENSQTIAKRLSTEHWIGLRKRPWSASSNSALNDTTTFWSRWANGDPLAFQNWYPGYPVFKSPYPRKQCCDCSCTCPARPTTTAMTSAWTRYLTPNSTNQTTNQWTTSSVSITNSTINSTTQNANSFTTAAPVTPLESECVQKPMLFHNVSDPDENYIEDPCVAMLSFGAWVERNCSVLLPFICAEERFNGSVNATDIKATSAQISWDRGPGQISHYRVLVNGDERNQTGTTYSLTNLIAGTLYSIQVFPVKCQRDLDPGYGTFYTVPHKVTGLQVTNQTETCVSLSWTGPEGNVDSYVVQTKSQKKSTRSENATVCDLTPGSLHTFYVSAAVKDRSQYSENSTISNYTAPAKVSNLETSEVTTTSLRLTWETPVGDATGYLVYTSWEGNNPISYINKTTEKKLTLTNLPSGTKITLRVTAEANGLKGQSQTVTCYTKPEDITDLTLTSTNKAVTARWSISRGSPSFTVELLPPDDLEGTSINTTGTNWTFSGLKSAANYTVIVYSVAADTQSSGFTKSVFTLPNPPRDATLRGHSKNNLTFSWTPPINTQTVQYLVTLNSSFWGQAWTTDLNNETTYTFENLTSGTNYTFYVQTKAGDLLSEAETLFAATDPAKREITLSMVCSSELSLHCDEEKTRANAFRELNSKFQSLLGSHVFWTLERMDTGDTKK